MSDFEREIQEQPDTVTEQPSNTGFIQQPINQQPIPVSSVPTPDSLANYGIQGVIVTLVIALGKPLIDKLYEFFSSSAKSKRAFEEEKYKQSVRASNILEESYKEQRTFMQDSMIAQGQAFNQAVKALMEAQQKSNETTEKFLQHVNNNFNVDNENSKKVISSIQDLSDFQQESLKVLMEISRKMKALSILCERSIKPKE